MNPLYRLTPKTRQVILVGGVAAIGAILTEHLLKPKMKGALRVR